MAVILADDIFIHNSFNENGLISIQISLNIIPKGRNKCIPVLVQTIAWRPQAIIWTNDSYFTDAYMHQSASMS